MPCPSTDSKFVFCILKFLKHAQFFMNTQYGNMACGVFKRGTVRGIAHICSKQWFQITADAHPGVLGVSKDQKFSEKFKNTHCQVAHPAKIE